MTSSLETQLIDAAIDLFGREGVDAVGTRAIAEAAGAQMSSITYHFGGKEELYLACARHIAAQMRDRVAPLLDMVRTTCDQSGDVVQARAAILAVLGGFVDMMMKDDIARIARFVVREQMNPTPAFEILFDGAMQPLIERMDELLRCIAKGRLKHDQVRICTVALVGHALTFRFARATLMRATGWKTIGARETKAVREMVVANANAILADLENGEDR